jgi:hypothetical protein
MTYVHANDKHCCAGAVELRKIFSLHLLKYHKKEAEHNIPGIVRQYLRAIN